MEGQGPFPVFFNPLERLTGKNIAKGFPGDFPRDNDTRIPPDRLTEGHFIRIFYQSGQKSRHRHQNHFLTSPPCKGADVLVEIAAAHERDIGSFLKQGGIVSPEMEGLKRDVKLDGPIPPFSAKVSRKFCEA